MRTRMAGYASAAAAVLVAAALFLPLWAFLTPSLGGPGAAVPPAAPPGAPPSSFDPAWLRSLLASAEVACGAAVLACLLGVAAAAGLIASGRDAGGLWTAACLLPLTLPPPVAVSGWVAATSRSTSLTASAFASRLPEEMARGILFSKAGCAAVLASLLWPLVALHALPAMRAAAASDAFAAARLAGPPRRAIMRIAVRLAWPEIATGTVLVFLAALSDFSVGSLLLVRVFPVEMFEAMAGRMDMAGAAAAGSVLFLATAVVGTMLHARTASRAEWERDREGGGASVLPAGSRRARLLWLSAPAAIFAATYLLPMAVLLGRCGGPAEAAGSLAAARGCIWTSMRLAIGTACLTAGAAALLGCIWAGRIPSAVATGAMMIAAAPGAAVASGLLRLFYGSGSPLAGTIEGFPLLSLGMSLRCLYIPLRLLDLGARSLPSDELDAARLAGRSSRSAFAAIVLPRLSAYLAAGAAVVFGLAAGDTALASLMFPPGETPLSVRLFEFQHYGYTEGVFAMALALGAVSALPVVCASIFLWRRRPEG